METTELLKKVRKIEIKTKGLSAQLFSGEYKSAFKGRGMSFSEVREYQPGDDVRTIDWNVTARLGHPYIKVFEEEREQTVMLLVDVSGSESFGTQKQLKQELITEIAATVAFSAIQNNDKVGVLFFSDRIEKFIPPQKGKSHILRIIRELLNFEPEGTKTDVALAVKYFTSVIKKRCTAFMLSDFASNDFTRELKIAAKKHDIIALNIFDEREKELPNIGFVKVKDSETGEVKWLDTGDKHVRMAFAIEAKNAEEQLKNTFSKSGVDYTTIATHQNYVQPLMNLFKRRM